VFRTEGYYNYRLIENGTDVAYGSTPAEYSTDVFAAKAVDFITTTPVGQPFFLYVTPYAPHRPATVVGTPYHGLFDGAAPWRPPSYNEADVTDKPSWVQALPVWSSGQTANIDDLRKRQLAALQGVDRAVKLIYDAVAARGELGSTVFIFASDNGQAWGEHRWDQKMCAYDECAKVPLVIRVPGVPARTDAHLVSLIDLAPSFAAWSGARHPKVNGLSLAKLVTNKDVSWRYALLLEMLEGDSSQQAMLYSAVRTIRSLYVEYLNGEREFYNLAVDPLLLQNAYTDPAYAGTIAGLQTVLAALKTR
jgi:arylsulfatase A-like enzyme